jgi:hypothetical protein
MLSWRGSQRASCMHCRWLWALMLMPLTTCCGERCSVAFVSVRLIPFCRPSPSLRHHSRMQMNNYPSQLRMRGIIPPLRANAHLDTSLFTMLLRESFLLHHVCRVLCSSLSCRLPVIVQSQHHHVCRVLSSSSSCYCQSLNTITCVCSALPCRVVCLLLYNLNTITCVVCSPLHRRVIVQSLNTITCVVCSALPRRVIVNLSTSSRVSCAPLFIVVVSCVCVILQSLSTISKRRTGGWADGGRS